MKASEYLGPRHLFHPSGLHPEVAPSFSQVKAAGDRSASGKLLSHSHKSRPQGTGLQAAASPVQAARCPRRRPPCRADRPSGGLQGRLPRPSLVKTVLRIGSASIGTGTGFHGKLLPHSHKSRPQGTGLQAAASPVQAARCPRRRPPCRADRPSGDLQGRLPRPSLSETVSK